ncbi:unnamed protein product [Protopolystoma xenopodis]|uniref:Fibronectin type-III domain-containing protein n=1 Tax=Protopolystoma xenopodis TaxID=117903 RepID=A0A3S5FFD9_9PLAT|nr:unnamed protein product [Protopolystoma xenopodis]
MKERTDDAPSEPTHLLIVDVREDSATLNWDMPASHFGGIESYVVQLFLANDTLNSIATVRNPQSVTLYV